MLGTKADDIKTLEKMRTHFIYRGHADLLTEMLVKVDSLISELTADNVEPPEFLFTFPNEGVFAEYEPDLFKWMGYNSVHQMFIARLRSEWMVLEHKPSIAVIVPVQYQEFILASGWAGDCIDARTEWARSHLNVIKIGSGYPSRGIIEEETG